MRSSLVFKIYHRLSFTNFHNQNENPSNFLGAKVPFSTSLCNAIPKIRLASLAQKSEITISCSALQLQNALSPISIIASGITILEMSERQQNAFFPILKTLPSSGIVLPEYAQTSSFSSLSMRHPSWM
jgi:hypothetical protein